MSFDYDLFVIGAGSAGVRLSRMASGLGAKVAVAEDRYLGGTCVNVGCVPKKLFVYASHVAEELEDGEGYGWSHDGKLTFDWPTLRENKNKEIARLNGVYENILGGAGVELIDGRARFLDKNTVEVNGKSYTAKYIAIATGGWPFVPEFEGSDLAITSNELFFLESLPKKAIVVGGGYIAIEMAGILNGLGVDTTLVYRGPLFLRGFDEEIREFVKAEVEKKGIKLSFNENISAIRKQDGGEFEVEFTSGSKDSTGMVLYATGRVPHTQDLGLENIDIALNKKGQVEINEHFESSIPGVFALGDISSRVQLTPVALAEGMYLSNYLFGDKPDALSYENIPTAVFCQPNIGTVGLTEEQAREQYGEVVVYKSSFKPMKHTLSGRDEKCFMKMLVDGTTQKVIGVHMVGADAGEIIQGIAVAMKAGATKQHFDQTIGIHPTAAEEFVTMRTPAS